MIFAPHTACPTRRPARATVVLLPACISWARQQQRPTAKARVRLLRYAGQAYRAGHFLDRYAPAHARQQKTSPPTHGPKGSKLQKTSTFAHRNAANSSIRAPLNFTKLSLSASSSPPNSSKMLANGSSCAAEQPLLTLGPDGQAYLNREASRVLPVGLQRLRLTPPITPGGYWLLLPNMPGGVPVRARADRLGYLRFRAPGLAAFAFAAWPAGTARLTFALVSVPGGLFALQLSAAVSGPPP